MQTSTSLHGKMLILVPTGALAEEIKDTSEGNVPVTIIDDTTGASPANGTVTLPDYIYYQNATYPYYVDRGDAVTLNVVPDEGYEIGDLRVTYIKNRAFANYHNVFNCIEPFCVARRICV